MHKCFAGMYNPISTSETIMPTTKPHSNAEACSHVYLELEHTLLPAQTVTLWFVSVPTCLIAVSIALVLAAPELRLALQTHTTVPESTKSRWLAETADAVGFFLASSNSNGWVLGTALLVLFSRRLSRRCKGCLQFVFLPLVVATPLLFHLFSLLLRLCLQFLFGSLALFVLGLVLLAEQAESSIALLRAKDGDVCADVFDRVGVFD